MSTVHSVQFYDTHQALIDRLCGVVSSALLVGNSVLVVATKDHRELLTKALQRLEVNVRNYAREGRFTMCDAEEMLLTFMVKDLPDPDLFRRSVGKLLKDVQRAARSTERGLTVFGEMVAVLWDKGNKAGALALEGLWNDLLNDQAFHLHCAYPRSLFSQDEPGMLNVCESHTHVAGLMTAVD